MSFASRSVLLVVCVTGCTSTSPKSSPSPFVHLQGGQRSAIAPGAPLVTLDQYAATPRAVLIHATREAHGHGRTAGPPEEAHVAILHKPRPEAVPEILIVSLADGQARSRRVLSQPSALVTQGDRLLVEAGRELVLLKCSRCPSAGRGWRWCACERTPACSRSRATSSRSSCSRAMASRSRAGTCGRWTTVALAKLDAVCEHE